MKNKILILALATICLVSVFGRAQNGFIGPQPVQIVNPYYNLTPISATAAVNNQTTLTIPAPTAGLTNYVCDLTFTAAQDNTSAANTSQVTTSTNFNSFALKYSLEATANKSLVINAIPSKSPGTGCVKSAASATATTFVSPSAIANTTFTWYATYYQAP